MTREDYLKGLMIKRFGSIRKFAEYTGIASSTIISLHLLLKMALEHQFHNYLKLLREMNFSSSLLKNKEVKTLKKVLTR